VCLHPVGGSALLWRGVAPQLSRHGRVLALDGIGFGLTPRAGRSAGIDRAQHTLARFLRATGSHPAVLVGHSMGSAVALLQAVRDPPSVRALILTSALLPPSFAGRSDRQALAYYLGRRIRMRARAGLRSLTRPPTLERFISDSLCGAAADPATIDPTLIHDSIALARFAGARETAASFAEAARSSFRVVVRGRAFREQLDSVECPVLLLHGTLDRTIPLPFAERVARDHPGWRFQPFPGLGHMLQLEGPTAWVAAVHAWLEAESGSAIV
jgi:pimeloyl-ACP methyl ester carboxylesterase